MGMSATQARILQNLARMSDLEYEMQQINEARMMLAQYTENAVTEYNNAKSNRVLFYTPSNEVYDESAKPYRLTYSDIVKPFEEGGLGYRLVSADGKIIVPYIPSDVPESEHGNYIVDLDVLNSTYLENGLRNLSWNFESPNYSNTSDDITWSSEDWRCTAGISDVLDTSDDGIAEAIYEQKLAHYQNQDKQLELRQKQIETEHTALQTEHDSLIKVCDEAIKKSFNTFG